MTNTLIDNSTDQLKMVNTLKQCITNKNCKSIKIATGYWDIPGTSLIYDELKEFLAKEGTTLQLLIGTDPLVRANQLKTPVHKDAKFPQDYIKRDIQTLNVHEKYVDVIRLIKEYCKESEAESKLQIRLYKQDENGNAQFFHAKCYVFSGIGYATGIIGSSNFTQNGLKGNSELNYLETDPARVSAEPKEISPSKGHFYWFDEKWNLSTQWNKTFLEEILKDAPITKKAEEPKIKDSSLTPYELYIKLLQHKFGDIVDLNQQQLIESYLPKHFAPLNYQIEAVKQCFSIMHEHGGFILADVVGLGKTVIGALIIKHFLTLADNDERERKTLIITPPAIQSAWKHTIEQFDIGKTDKMESEIDFITTGSIGKLINDFDEADNIDEMDSGEFSSDIEYKNYGLIIIDESHKFRNNGTTMYQALDDLIAQIGTTTGAYPYIGLLSATPQNNRPADLQNQIYLFERNHTDSTLKKAKGGNLEGFFSEINKRYTRVIKARSTINDSELPNETLTVEERRKELQSISSEIRDCVLQDILVRRTRTDVQKYYTDDINKQGIIFPQISGPHSFKYQMEAGLATLFADTMSLIAPSLDFKFDNSDYLCYYRYRAIEFFNDPTKKLLYKGRNLDADRFSQQLAKIMQINLVKRIESSFSAFKTSLENLRRYTQNMIDMWEQNIIFICPDINVNAELNPEKHYDKTHKLCSFEDCANDIRAKIEKLDKNGKNEKGRNREFTRNDFNTEYIKLLRKDLQLITFLCKRWNSYSNDPKLEEFKNQLRDTLFNKARNEAQKLVIFSEAIDTAKTIKLAVESIDKNLKVLVVTAKNRHECEQIICENFDANYKGEWKNDYQVIVTTEVLAEGVNLHRANCILNYDTPWNSTRLMQRIGRVNRIGSQALQVYVYNFMPSAQGDAQIQLVQKAHTKLQSFHTLFGEDSQIFSEAEEIMHYDLNQQINGEESPMEKYIFELKEYKEKHPERFRQIAETKKGLELATPTIDGKSYFLVRNSQISGMFVRINTDLKADIISAIDMYKNFRTDKDTNTIPLPVNWNLLKAKAELAVNQALAKMNIHAKNSQKATKAKEIITRIKDTVPMSKESRNLLATAFTFVNKGNQDIIKKIIALDELRSQNGNSLFELTQDEFDAIIQSEIQNIISNVQHRYGKAQTYIAISK